MLIEKRSEMKMDREEIYEMVIREMTETAVREGLRGVAEEAGCAGLFFIFWRDPVVLDFYSSGVGVFVCLHRYADDLR